MKITVKCTFLPQADLQRSLAFEAESDPTIMDQEQTWPTAEELEQAQTEEHRRTKRVPKGTSEYQAAWIVSDEEDEADDEDGKGRVDDDQVRSLVPLSLSLSLSSLSLASQGFRRRSIRTQCQPHRRSPIGRTQRPRRRGGGGGGDGRTRDQPEQLRRETRSGRR